MDRDELDKKRREVLRWRILQALNISRPWPLGEDVLLQIVSGPDMQATQFDLRRELDYLESRELLELTGRDQIQWEAKLTRHGVDLVEYEIPCEPGVARPQKYWGRG